MFENVSFDSKCSQLQGSHEIPDDFECRHSDFCWGEPVQGGLKWLEHTLLETNISHTSRHLEDHPS